MKQDKSDVLYFNANDPSTFTINKKGLVKSFGVKRSIKDILPYDITRERGVEGFETSRIEYIRNSLKGY